MQLARRLQRPARRRLQLRGAHDRRRRQLHRRRAAALHRRRRGRPDAHARRRLRPPRPQAQAGRQVVVRPVSGKILVKRPGSTEYVELDETTGIPVGSSVDTRAGKIKLTFQPVAGGPVQQATFYGGIFLLTQRGKTLDLKLTEELAPCSKRAKSSAAKKPKTRRLWGDGKGKFRTSGQYSAATVRGTTWLVQDSCEGTLTRVKVGVVAVRDNVKHKTVVLRAGKHYLAKPRR